VAEEMKNIIQMIALCGCVLATPAWAQNATIGIEQFDSWIFQGNANQDQAKSTLESRIELEITRIAQTVSLTDDQKERLKLAGNGDIKRFYDRVEKARRQFLSMGEQWEQNRINEAYQLAVPLQQELRKGLFGSDSLLQKVVATTVTEEQSEEMRKETERLMQLRKESAVKVFLAGMGRQIPMTSTQRSKLTELVMQQMTSIGDDDAYTNYLVSYRLSEVPLDDYKDLFDEAQMKAINQSTQQGKAMKAMLEQRGLLNEQP
jgi:hypothetical protein